MKHAAIAAVLTVVLGSAPAAVTAQSDALIKDSIAAVPQDDLFDVKEHPWSYVAVRPDGMSLEVYWLDGAPECSGFDRVEVAQGEAGLDVRVFAGTVPDALACPKPLLTWMTIVELEEPLILGGREQSPPAS